ncbi:uncharacterized protein LOC132741272 [Ruditapes philippinarum]|uniref:uncharacterized protein LOC132741272 n=1 Tax=Ruditapes philippinarum TaxID=129788 RepID=UPI00295B8901|nr:uncharacterized protein LOC132741272 [Ruditapes philippinarum]
MIALHNRGRSGGKIRQANVPKNRQPNPYLRKKSKDASSKRKMRSHSPNKYLPARSLNDLLNHISLAIDKNELKTLKLILTGPEKISGKLFEEYDTCRDLFTKLRQNGHISENDVSILFRILFILGRKDLQCDAEQYTVDKAVPYAYSIMLPFPYLSDQQRLNAIWKRTGKKGKIYEECEKICKLIESISNSILHVWPAYDTKANDDIVFVVLTKSIEDKLHVEEKLGNIGYNIFVKNIDSTGKESEAVLQKLNKLKKKPQPLTYSQKEDIKVAIRKNSDRLLQNHQYLSAISGSNVRSKNFMLKQSEYRVPFQPCIVLYVIAKGKIPLHESKFENHIDGIPVDVREGIFETTTLPFEKYTRPVQMGCQITSNDTSPSYGTLGGFYYHSDFGLCGITCAHVVLNWDNMNKLKGEKQVLSSASPMVFQPDTTRPRHQLGPVKEVVYREGNEKSSGIDMAIFKLEDNAPESGRFPGSEICFETGRTLGTSGLRYNTQVLKYGRTTGLTRGYIEFEETTVRLCKFQCQYTIKNDEHPYLLKKQIEIRPDISESPQFKLFNDGGDSGAFVFAKDSDDQLACIGMCVGKLNSNGIVIPISVIKEEFGISQFCDFQTKHLSEQIQEINKEMKMMNGKLDRLLSRK